MNLTELIDDDTHRTHARSALAAGGVSIHSFRRSVSTEFIDAVRVAIQRPTAFGGMRAVARWLSFGLIRGSDPRLIHEIVLDRDDIHVRLVERHCEKYAVLSRYWTRVALIEPAHPGEHTKLVLEHKGEVVELGEFLSDTPRRLLADWLQRLIGPMGAAPPLSVALGYPTET